MNTNDMKDPTSVDYWLQYGCDICNGGIKNATPNEEGILICNTCGQPRQKWRTYEGSSRMFLSAVGCRCCEEEEAREKAEKKAQDIKNMRNLVFGIGPNKKKNYTFAADDGRNPLLAQKLRYYCEHFEEFRKEGSGILLYSKANGGGKTFMACAIANNLIDQSYRVRVCDIAELRDEMMHGDDRSSFFHRLVRNHLIVLDDLGMESVSAATKEAEYRIINEITENRVPLVVTTNYTPKEMLECTDRDRKRVYDRILGNCAILDVEPPEGKSRRLDKCRMLTDRLKQIDSEESSS